MLEQLAHQLKFARLNLQLLVVLLMLLEMEVLLQLHIFGRGIMLVYGHLRQLYQAQILLVIIRYAPIYIIHLELTNLEEMQQLGLVPLQQMLLL